LTTPYSIITPPHPPPPTLFLSFFFQKALGEGKALAQVYGGIVGLTHLGPSSVDKVLLPLLPTITRRLDDTLAATSSKPSPSSSSAGLGGGAAVAAAVAVVVKGGKKGAVASSSSVAASSSSSSSTSQQRLKAHGKAYEARKCKGALLEAMRVFLDDFNLKVKPCV
jgi:hypothetical protein